MVRTFLFLMLFSNIICAGELEMAFVNLDSLNPETAIEIVKPLLSEAGRVHYFRRRNAMMVYEEPENIARIRKLIHSVDVPAANVRIKVAFSESFSANQHQAGLTVTEGRVVIWDGHVDVSVRGKGEIGAGSQKRSEKRAITLLAGDNREARIWVGKRVPHQNWFFRFGCRKGYWRSETVYRDIGASLWIKPTVVGDKVKLSLYPKLTLRRDDESQQVIVRELETQVTVKSGHEIVIGGFEQEHQAFYSYLIGVAAEKVASKVKITLCPTIEKLK